jgi:hypothetical protein
MSARARSSPYFSPNSIIAPVFWASSMSITAATVAALARISALTMASIGGSVGGHRRVVGEVEAGALGIDQRALLLHVAAQHFAQGLVHQVGGRVVAHGAARARRRPWRHGVAHLQRALDERAVVAEHVGLDLLVSSTARACAVAQLAWSPTWPPDSA